MKNAPDVATPSQNRASASAERRCVTSGVYRSDLLQPLDLGVLFQRDEVDDAAPGLARHQRRGPHEAVLPVRARALGFVRRAHRSAHPLIELVLDAAADLELDLDQLGVGVAPEK